jgi:hypothetical protein
MESNFSNKKRGPRKKPELNPIFRNIKDRHSLILYLQKNPNQYNDFILDKILLNRGLNNRGMGMEDHHIIPVHAGGKNKNWNLVSLTKNEHIKAHKLRILSFNEAGDKLMVHFRKQGKQDVNYSETSLRPVFATRMHSETKEILKQTIELKHIPICREL